MRRSTRNMWFGELSMHSGTSYANRSPYHDFHFQNETPIKFEFLPHDANRLECASIRLPSRHIIDG